MTTSSALNLFGEPLTPGHLYLISRLDRKDAIFEFAGLMSKNSDGTWSAVDEPHDPSVDYFDRDNYRVNNFRFCIRGAQYSISMRTCGMWEVNKISTVSGRDTKILNQKQVEALIDKSEIFITHKKVIQLMKEGIKNIPSSQI